LALAGLLNNIIDSAILIDRGRKGFTIPGDEHNGRINYERGISRALSIFQEAQSTADPQILILVELTFLQQEFQFCNEADAITRNSLKAAIQSFNDALRCLKTVEDAPSYRFVETAFPTSPKYRVYDDGSHLSFPRDAVHLACAAHWTRLQNVIRSPGINMTEKAVLQQRAANMKTIQGSYVHKQAKALT
jgi:hypothetical protein